MKSLRVVCAHDCPDMCSLIAHVEDGKVVRVQGDPDHPYTAGFACGKVNRDADLVNSPERVGTPLRRSGPKGSGQFKPISWDEALDEITDKWKAIIGESGPLAVLGYAYSAHQGLLNRGLVLGLFHALGTSRLQAGTVCDTCCEAAWDMTLGPVGGADPESVVHSDLMISWGADLAATNVHFWALAEAQRKQRGMPIVVIDPRRTRSAKAADLYLPIRIGTDAALALGLMHILVRDKLADRAYLARHTLGFDKVEREILPKFTPARTAEITGLAAADIEKLAAMYGKAKAALIRLGEGMTRLTHGGQALRTVALLPGVSGHYAVKGGGAFLLTAASCDLNYAAVRKPSGPASTRLVNHLRLGEELLVLSRGRVSASGAKERIFRRPPTVEVARLTGCKNFSRARALAEGLVEAVDWGCQLRVGHSIAHPVAHVGIRAHHLDFVESSDTNAAIENTFPCWLVRSSETPFRITLYLRLHKPPSDARNYHLQAEVYKEKWERFRHRPFPWHLRISADQLVLFPE